MLGGVITGVFLSRVGKRLYPDPVDWPGIPMNVDPLPRGSDEPLFGSVNSDTPRRWADAGTANVNEASAAVRIAKRLIFVPFSI